MATPPAGSRPRMSMKVLLLDISNKLDSNWDMYKECYEEINKALGKGQSAVAWREQMDMLVEGREDLKTSHEGVLFLLRETENALKKARLKAQLEKVKAQKEDERARMPPPNEPPRSRQKPPSSTIQTPAGLFVPKWKSSGSTALTQAPAAAGSTSARSALLVPPSHHTSHCTQASNNQAGPSLNHIASHINDNRAGRVESASLSQNNGTHGLPSNGDNLSSANQATQSFPSGAYPSMSMDKNMALEAADRGAPPHAGGNRSNASTNGYNPVGVQNPMPQPQNNLHAPPMILINGMSPATPNPNTGQEIPTRTVATTYTSSNPYTCGNVFVINRSRMSSNSYTRNNPYLNNMATMNSNPYMSSTPYTSNNPSTSNNPYTSSDPFARMTPYKSNNPYTTQSSARKENANDETLPASTYGGHSGRGQSMPFLSANHEILAAATYDNRSGQGQGTTLLSAETNHDNGNNMQ